MSAMSDAERAGWKDGADAMRATIIEQEKRIEKLRSSIRTARALADHAIHCEHDLATIEDVHEVLSNALLVI